MALQKLSPQRLDTTTGIILTPGTSFETARNVMAHLETSKRLRKEKTLLPK